MAHRRLDVFQNFRRDDKIARFHPIRRNFGSSNVEERFLVQVGVFVAKFRSELLGRRFRVSHTQPAEFLLRGKFRQG